MVEACCVVTGIDQHPSARRWICGEERRGDEGSARCDEAHREEDSRGSGAGAAVECGHVLEANAASTFPVLRGYLNVLEDFLVPLVPWKGIPQDAVGKDLV